MYDKESHTTVMLSNTCFWTFWCHLEHCRLLFSRCWN